MQARIAWAVVLFTVATIATVRLGSWLSKPLLAPVSALVVALVGAILIGLAPSGAAQKDPPQAQKS